LLFSPSLPLRALIDHLRIRSVSRPAAIRYIIMVSARDSAIKGQRIPLMESRERERPESSAFPPTVIVRDPRENPKKCTILPLRGRSDLIILSYPASSGPDFAGYVRLAPEGPELSPADASSGLLLLDGSWRRAQAMTKAYQHIPTRSLTGYRTAYPRVSKKGTDPSQGLATVEALFLAYHILRRPTAGVLDHYRWAEEFLRLNNLLSQ
jgi:pre-rRNA-processing protein TSR3